MERALPAIRFSVTALLFAVLLAAACGGDKDVSDDKPTATAEKPVISPETSTPPGTSAGPGDAQETRWTFDEDVIGAPPTGAEVFSGSWAVRDEAGAPSAPNALCQTATAEFPALSLGDETFRDVEVTARFKPISGETDQAAGIIVRIQDRDNYYIARANALESNVAIYKYVGGQRSFVAEGAADVKSGEWQELRVEVTGATIRAFFAGEIVVEAEDSDFTDGMIGLWTKADSVTCFDDVQAIAR